MYFAPSSKPSPRRPGAAGIQLRLGSIWLPDAALQFQPFMFGPSLVRVIIERAAFG